MNPFTFLELLLLPEFLAGLGWGFIGLGVLAVASQKRPLTPIWGIVATGAALVASVPIVGQRLALALGLVIVALGGELTRRSQPAGVLVVAAGAFVVALGSGIDTVWWIHAGSLLFIISAGWMIERVDDHAGQSGIPVLMAAGTVFGVWATVPDTEVARILMGAVTATIIAGWPLRKARIGAGGAYAIAALLAWAVAIGGEARAGSIIGGWATVGAFTAALLGSSVRRILPVGLFTLHAGSVLVASRIVGPQESPYVALAIAAPALILTLAIGWSLARQGDTPADRLKPPRPGETDP